MTVYKPRPERWPQVGLKGFFVLMTLLCVLLGWLGAQVKWIRDREEVRQRHFNWEGYMGGYHRHLRQAPWSIRILGEAGDTEITLRKGTSVAERKRIENLFPEADIFLDGEFPSRIPPNLPSSISDPSS